MRRARSSTVLVLARRKDIFALLSPKRRLAGPKYDWVDHQAQLVHKVVLYQHVPELEASGDEDFAI